MIILGIDPGTLHTGFGLIEVSKNDRERVIHLEHGVISLAGKVEGKIGSKVGAKVGLPVRLNRLQQKLSEVIQKYQPEHMVIERAFLGKNFDSAFKLGHARGVCMQVMAQQGGRIFEYAARQVKQVITGHGNADKDQVHHLVERFLQIEVGGSRDASDALALALCHSRYFNDHILNAQTGAEL